MIKKEQEYKHEPIEYRFEHKFIIPELDAYCIERRLRRILELDPHSLSNGNYYIRSLYFDTLQNTALHEKINGDCRREKFRIRYYNTNSSFLRLEKKIKHFQRTAKFQSILSFEVVKNILMNQVFPPSDHTDPLVEEFKIKILTTKLHPVSIVIYNRTAFLYNVNDVRITIDRHVKATTTSFHTFLQPTIPTYPVITPGNVIIEVKYDHFLPEFIQDLIMFPNMQISAASKYAASRLYL
ncbi:MAG: polyphosphate polymerase domain-containing protein [Caldisericia bacterium]|nr:polyphosphate polymerase domain-containing protein [Caldisericia bacterium]MDD4615288.1 polyphosphate polymerase domain-containing protein [Caldisericia bacterium]